MTRHKISKKIMFIYLVITMLISYGARAGETRLLTAMPTGTKLSAVDVKKSKKPAYDCQSVKIGPKGNWINVPNAKSYWFAEVGETQDNAEDQTKAVRCKLKIYDREKHRMANADLGEDAE